MNGNTNDTLLGNDDDMETMLNQTLDSVKAAPDFSNPPAGEYRLGVKDAVFVKAKEAGKNHNLRITYSVLTTYSVATGEAPVPDETMFSENFQYTEKGLPYFKSRVMGVLNVTDVDGVSIKDMLESIKGQAFDCRITIKKSPNPKGGEYENVNIRIVPPSA